MEGEFKSIRTFQDRSGNRPFRNLKSIYAKPITHDLDRVVGYATKPLDHPEAKRLMREFPLCDQMPSHNETFREHIPKNLSIKNNALRSSARLQGFHLGSITDETLS